ncbi:hypothetical protein [Sulfitobacter guttiformis]|nr:hypothetical protein [Sulfitobacter guttiformis]KIN74477.1 hypothetical protein Z949_3676 [Sulfitobacter guttiformis KCTC 32187]
MQLEASLEGVDRLLLVPGNGDPAAHHNVIAAAKAVGVERII